MKTVAVVVCNNGFGHIKRVLHLVRRLHRRLPGRLRTDLYVDVEKLKKFSSLIRALFRTRESIRYFDVQGRDSAYEPEILSKYPRSLPTSDFVWSDNLVFPLRYRADTFLTGSFLWLEIHPDRADSQKDREILSQSRPIMMANRYFATPAVIEMTECRGVGMYEYFSPRSSSGFPGALLLSCGGSLQGRSMFEEKADRLAEILRSAPSSVEIFVEPDFYPRLGFMKNVKKADFSERMWACVSAAVIRPGMGTICDVLAKGGRIFAFGGENDYEIRHNATVLETLGVGTACSDAEAALCDALAYLSRPDLQMAHRARLGDIDFGGLEETAGYISEIVS